MIESLCLQTILLAEVAEDIHIIFPGLSGQDRQCTGPCTRDLPGQDSAEIKEDGFPVGGVAGCEHPGRVGSLCLSSGSPALAAHDDWRQTVASRSPAQSLSGK
jgi:hypothetical protein